MLLERKGSEAYGARQGPQGAPLVRAHSVDSRKTKGRSEMGQAKISDMAFGPDGTPHHITFLDLPPCALLLIAAQLPLKYTNHLVTTCRTLHTLFTDRNIKSVHAAARAMVQRRKPGRQSCPEAIRVLKGVRCTPAAVTWVRCLTASPQDTLLNPSLAEWMASYAGIKGDFRTLEWLLQLWNDQEAVEMRKLYHILWDRVWLTAAGHAAAGQHTTLLTTLMSQPCAPGRHHGLKQLQSEYQTRLLCGAVSGLDPRTGLASVFKLCLLPEKEPRIRWPWENPEEDPEMLAIEAGRKKALLQTAFTAMQNGFKDAINALVDVGLDLNGNCQQLMSRALVHDQGEALLALLKLPHPNSPELVHAHAIICVMETWCQAISQGKIKCLQAMLEVEHRRLFRPNDICKLAKLYPAPVALITTEFLLTHPLVPITEIQQYEQCLASAIRARSPEFVELLIRHGCQVSITALAALVNLCQPCDILDGDVQLLPLLLEQLLLAPEAQTQGLQQVSSAGRVISLLATLAGHHKTILDSMPGARHCATPANRCAHLLLDYLLELPHVPSVLHRAYQGYKDSGGDGQVENVAVESANASAMFTNETGLALLNVTMTLRETRLFKALLALPYYEVIQAKQPVMEVVCQYIRATSRDRDPSLLLDFARRGTTISTVVKAVLAIGDYKLTLNLLQAMQREAKDALSVPAGIMFDTECEDVTCWGHICYACDWEVDMSSWNAWCDYVTPVVDKVASTGCSQARAVLQQLIKSCKLKPVASWVVHAPQASMSKHHYRFLNWMLEESSLATCLAGTFLERQNSIHGQNMVAGERLARWAPLPFVVACARHGIDPGVLLAGLCQRNNPPMVLIEQLLRGEVANLARARPAAPANFAPAIPAPALRTLDPVNPSRSASTTTTLPVAIPDMLLDAAGNASQTISITADSTGEITSAKLKPNVQAHDSGILAPGTPAAGPAKGLPQSSSGYLKHVVNWQHGRLLEHAVCGQSLVLVDLLIAGGSNLDLAVHCPTATPELLLRIFQQNPQAVDVDILAHLIASAQRPTAMVSQLLSIGVDLSAVMLAAVRSGREHAVACLVDVYGADPCEFLEQPVITAAQYEHMGVVALLVQRGASLHAALYGTVAAGSVEWSRQLLALGADPQWDKGAAVEAAMQGGNETLIDLLVWRGNGEQMYVHDHHRLWC